MRSVMPRQRGLVLLADSPVPGCSTHLLAWLLRESGTDGLFWSTWMMKVESEECGKLDCFLDTDTVNSFFCLAGGQALGFICLFMCTSVTL
ncbi:hypothetical protein Micbo1qcDRAFT_164431, partial [Microdochium bolleyi]